MKIKQGSSIIGIAALIIILLIFIWAITRLNLNVLRKAATDEPRLIPTVRPTETGTTTPKPARLKGSPLPRTTLLPSPSLKSALPGQE